MDGGADSNGCCNYRLHLTWACGGYSGGKGWEDGGGGMGWSKMGHWCMQWSVGVLLQLPLRFWLKWLVVFTELGYSANVITSTSIMR